MAATLTVAAQRSYEWQGQGVDLTTVDRQLSSLWKQLANESETACPVRTHVFNLVVYTESRSEADRIAGGLKKLASRHPSRAIILISDRAEERSSIDAELTVECPPEAANLPSLCYECIVLTIHGRAADHLSSVVIPLLMADLPTYLWWPGQPPFGHRALHRLLSVADQLVIDSAEFASPGDGYADLARLCSGKQGVNDFNWARLAAWREIIAQFFDGPTLAPYASAIRSVRVEFGAGGENYARPMSGVLLLVGWMASRLGWEPETTLDSTVKHAVTLSVLQGDRVIEIDFRFRSHGDPAAGRLMLVEIHCEGESGEHAVFTVSRSADLQHAHIATHTGDGQDLSRVIPLNIQSDEELLADELEAAGHDQLYESVVEMASRVAGRELWAPA